MHKQKRQGDYVEWKITERNQWETTENSLASWVRQCMFCSLAGSHFLEQRLKFKGAGAILKDINHDLSTDGREVKVWSSPLAQCLGKSFVITVHNSHEVQHIPSYKFPLLQESEWL